MDVSGQPYCSEPSLQYEQSIPTLYYASLVSIVYGMLTKFVLETQWRLHVS
jgi:hypothetical protein